MLDDEHIVTELRLQVSTTSPRSDSYWLMYGVECIDQRDIIWCSVQHALFLQKDQESLLGSLCAADKVDHVLVVAEGDVAPFQPLPTIHVLFSSEHILVKLLL